MQHRIEDYTDSDLRVAIGSPYQPLQFMQELIAELIRRQHNEQLELPKMFRRK